MRLNGSWYQDDQDRKLDKVVFISYNGCVSKVVISVAYKLRIVYILFHLPCWPLCLPHLPFLLLFRQ